MIAPQISLILFVAFILMKLMAWGLPKLPGYTFPDPTKTAFQTRSSLKFYQGYRFPDTQVVAPGGSPTDVDSNAFSLPEDCVNYDPSLTYGRVKQAALPQVVPHFVHYDKRCLNFKAYFQQPVYDSPDEAYRVRIVNIIYFLGDDTMTVMEPPVRNSGIWQGRLVTRGKIPKNDMGEFWHWKDLNVAKDICIYGKVFHTVSCDLFSKEWLESQGIEIAPEETIPEDSYLRKEKWKQVRPPPKPKVMGDPLRRFLEYDGKVLSFDVLWDNRDMPYGELEKLKLLYFLQDDKIAIKELPDPRGGKDPFALLLKKTKLPKNYKVRPVNFPAVALEVTDDEVTEYYSPCDLIVGETIFVLGRRMLIVDCDDFSRMYYKTMLNIEQPPPVNVPTETEKEFTRTYPPHIGIGTPEDSLGSCFGLVPKAPHKDIIKYNLNANKYLRYLCKLEWIHPEDHGRRFILSYSLADGTVKIGEIPRRNSGIREGQFLKSMKLQLPDSDPNFPTYFTPDKFYIGAIVPVFKHRFQIIGCDLFVYRYMSANTDKFPKEVLENVRNYHMREGNLKDEFQEACQEEQAAETHSQLAKIGQSAVAEPSSMEQCLTALNVVEGMASPPRPPTPPMTSDVISYDDTIRAINQSKQVCDGLTPLKGILKSGLPKEDQQKVVCFTGAAVDKQRGEPEQKPITHPPGQQPHYDDSEDFCDKYRDPGVAERAERRARGECPYEMIPNDNLKYSLDDDEKKPKQPGVLHQYGVDCTQIPNYMRLPSDAYEKVKPLRKDVPEISPAAEQKMYLPREPFKDIQECLATPQLDKVPADPARPCPPKKPEDVAFGCPRVEPVKPDCSANYPKYDNELADFKYK